MALSKLSVNIDEWTPGRWTSDSTTRPALRCVNGPNKAGPIRSHDYVMACGDGLGRHGSKLWRRAWVCSAKVRPGIRGHRRDRAPFREVPWHKEAAVLDWPREHSCEMFSGGKDQQGLVRGSSAGSQHALQLLGARLGRPVHVPGPEQHHLHVQQLLRQPVDGLDDGLVLYNKGTHLTCHCQQ